MRKESNTIRREMAALATSLERRYPVTLLTSFDEKEDAIVINLIEVGRSQRRKGVGTKIVGEMSVFADGHRLKMMARPREPSGGRIGDFFRRSGFKRRPDGWLVREPARSRGTLSGMATAKRAAPPGFRVVEAAGNYIELAEKLFTKKQNSEAAIWGLEQAYLAMSQRVKGAKRREYLKRATLLRMMLNELWAK